jgi:hypothetical protein
MNTRRAHATFSGRDIACTVQLGKLTPAFDAEAAVVRIGELPRIKEGLPHLETIACQSQNSIVSSEASGLQHL